MSDVFISRDAALRDLLAAATYLAERIRSADGHAEAMKAIIPLYLAADNVDLAAELSNAVGDPFSRDRLIALVAEKCADLDDDDYALQLADAIEDEALRSQALEKIGILKARKGASAAAAAVADSMIHPDFVYAEMAVHALAADPAACDEHLAEISYPGASVGAMVHIASGMIGTGQSDEAVNWLDRAVGIAGDIEHNEERIRTLTDIGNLFGNAGRNDKAIETLEVARQQAEALDNMHRDFFLVGCAVGFMHAGSDDLMDRTLDSVGDKTQMASALVAIAVDEWSKGDHDAGRDSLDEAYSILRSQRDNEIRDPRSRTGLITAVAGQFAAFERTDRAIEICLDLPDPDDQANGLSQVAQVLAGNGDDDQARATIEMIDDDASRTIALMSISDVKEKKGDREGSLSFLDTSAELTASIPQLGLRSEILNAIAERFAARGQTERARTIALENLHNVSEIRDESVQAASLAELSRVYAEAGLKVGDDETRILDILTRG